ncbi:hypothetical protein KUTeg_008369 [Tegillarca granosa]|uniref:G-protein coupled receptors family 2 profile 2 domain-containing protein n=1 Tax=Tegillarca granosa TaxID=220873 RepID=A0ABQ9F8Z2_TEGGR|nr:hypothetical protein KUTeg_008369 [Tegillarca granosa]
MQPVSHLGFPNDCWLPSHNTSYREIEDWDYIYTGPILFVLAINMLFLASIIWVLVTKLRASHTMESRQLRKAVKATLLLFPLLGITYIIFLWSPNDVPAVVEAHKLVNALLQSFQGFFVALFYCFLNGEVKSVLKKKFKLMQDSRNLSTRYTKTSIGWANDLSRKESLALANGRISMGYYDNRNLSNDRTMDYEREETENML